MEDVGAWPLDVDAPSSDGAGLAVRILNKLVKLPQTVCKKTVLKMF